MLALADRHQADHVAHAELGHHPAGQRGGPLDVVPGTGGHRALAEDDLLGGATAEEHRQAPHQPVTRVVVPVGLGKRGGEAQRPSARDDGDLVHRVAARRLDGHDRVSRLVVGRQASLLLGEHQRAPLDPEHDLVLRLLEIGHRDRGLAGARREQRRLVDQVGEVGARPSPGSRGRSSRAARRSPAGSCGCGPGECPRAPSHRGHRPRSGGRSGPAGAARDRARRGGWSRRSGSRRRSTRSRPSRPATG